MINRPIVKGRGDRRQGNSDWGSVLSAENSLSKGTDTRDCHELNCVSLKSYVEVLTLSSSERDHIWKEVCYRCDLAKLRSYQSREGHLSNMTGILIKRSTLDRDLRTPCEGKDKGDASTRQVTRKVASQPPEGGGKHGTDSHSQPSEGIRSADVLILDL